MRLFCLLLIILNIGYCNVGQASAIRQANRAIRSSDLGKAEKIYNFLPNTDKLLFNKGYLELQKQDKEKAQQYYEQLFQRRSFSNKEKANAYLNIGNSALRSSMDIKEAISNYRKGLLLDPKNRKLKYNLELANGLRLVQPQAQQKKDQKNKGKSEKSEQKQQKSQSEREAERTLDSFKQQEAEDLKYLKKDQKVNVEKDW